MASRHFVPLRQRHRRGRHEQVLQSCVHGVVLRHRGRRESADYGALGWEHSSSSLKICCRGLGNDAQVLLERGLTPSPAERHFGALQ